MSRSDVPRADSRPGVRAPEGVLAPEGARAPESARARELREGRAPASSAFTTTLAYGVASSRRDQPPPPPMPRANGVPEPRSAQQHAPQPKPQPAQRDSSSLLDLEAKRPEELHLRFEPVTGIAPALPEPRVRRTSPAGMPVPPAATSRPRADFGVQGTPARPTVNVAAHPAPRLSLRERGLDDSSPTTQFVAQPTRSGMKARYWAYGLAVGLGAAGLVAAGYSAAFMQLTSRDEPTLTSQTSTAAATAAEHTGAPAPTGAAAPAAPARDSLPMLAVTAERNETGDEPAMTTGSRSKSAGGRTHASRARSVPTAPSEPTPTSEGASPSDTDEQASAVEPFQQPSAAAPRMEPNPVPSATSAANAPAPRLIIRPLGDPPEPSAPPTANVPEPPTPSPTREPAVAEPTPSAAPEPTAPQENLPAQLSRDDIQQQLLGMRDKLATCAGSQHGTSYANVTINGTGKVSYSTIDGAFAGTPAGSCMARTLRGATFPRFAGPQMTVRYPYVF